jgi:hypothetical protein
MKTIDSKLNILIFLLAILTIINFIALWKMTHVTKENYPSEFSGGYSRAGSSSNIFNSPAAALSFAERDYRHEQKDEAALSMI